jgi:hypothetical protein
MTVQHDYFLESMMISSGFALLALLPFLLLGLAIPYAILRIRELQSRETDPQLGLKAALHFFFSLGILITLTGLTVLIVNFIVEVDPLWSGSTPKTFFNPEPFPNSIQRAAMGLIVAGLFFTGIHFLFIIALTRDQGRSATRRVFLGWRFAIHGIVVMVAVTLLTIVLFQRSSDPIVQMRKQLIGVLFVWVPSWLAHFVLLRASSPAPQARALTTWQPPANEWEESPSD